MATQRGIYGLVKSGSTNIIAQVRTWNFSETADESDITVMNIGGNKTFDSGAIETSGSISCFWDDSDALGQDTLVVGNTVTLELYPGPDTSGNTYWTGDAKILSRDIQSSTEGTVEATFNFKINGGITRNTVTP